MIETATTVEARNRFSRLVNRVAFGRERLAITRRDIRRAGA
jgi:antitoxin (DNA-binding transcriptional repressor) of toxin-antitoxin stability system